MRSLVLTPPPPSPKHIPSQFNIPRGPWTFIPLVALTTGNTATAHVPPPLGTPGQVISKP